MWQLQNIRVVYRLYDGRQHLGLDGVTLTVAPGEKLAVVGPNGSGKSTLAMVLAGIFPPSGGGILRHTTGPHALSEKPDHLNDALLLFQDPDDNLIGETPLEDVALALESVGQPEQRHARALRKLADAGLEGLARRPVNRLSGGEKQSVALVSALATRRSLIVLDEPTSHLDPPSRRSLLDRLLRMDAERAAPAIPPAVVLVTQYADEAKSFPRILELRAGKVAYDGPSGEWTAPSNERHDPVSVDSAAEPRLLVRTQRLTQFVSPNHPESGELLSGITLRIGAGDRIALVGPMGAGKTTLAFHLARVDTTTADSVIVTNESGEDGLPVVMIQFPERQLFCPTVLEDVRLGCESRNLPENQVQSRAVESLESVGLDPRAVGDLSPFVLSGGQRRRVALACIAAIPASVYILDEPTASLDQDGLDRLEEIVGRWTKDGAAVVLISHDIDWLRRLTTRLWVLDRGRMIYDGHWSDQSGAGGALTAIGFK